MFDWKVKAVAIQLRPTTKWPTPNDQPTSKPRSRVLERQISSHRTAKATGSSGHQPTGSNANADAAPRNAATSARIMDNG